MAQHDLVVFNSTEKRLEVPQAGDVAVSLRPVEINGTAEYGVAADFQSKLRCNSITADLNVDGLYLFSTYEAQAITGTIDVVDNGGILVYGSRITPNVGVRMANPEYVDVIAVSGLAQRNVKDGSDIGSQYVYLTGGHFAVQQDSTTSAHCDDANGLVSLTKMENGSATSVRSIVCQAQIGTSVNRNFTAGQVVQSISTEGYLIGRTGGNSSITDFYAMRLVAPQIAGTVTITNRWGIVQEDTAATNRFDGLVRLPNLPTSSAGLPAGTLWNDAGTLKVA